MKRFGIAVMVVVVAATVSSQNNALQQLGIKSADASHEVVSSFINGNVSTYRVAAAMRKAAPAARAAMVEQGLVWTKAYVDSPQFAKDYAAMRDESKPQKEEKPSIDDELKARREQRLADMEEAKKNLAEMPKEYRAAAEAGLKAAEESMKQLDTAEYRKMEREGLVMERKADEERYQQELADWSESNPADPQVLVKQRLQEFLEATKDVDFDAELVTKYGKQRFVDPDYESKPGDWKLAYRAGKETTEKARAFAKSWLAEVGRN